MRASNRATPRSKGWNSPHSRLYERVPDPERLVTKFNNMAMRLRTVEFHSMDAIDLITKTDYPEYVLYCDPPYPDTIGQGMYEHEDVDHETLARVLNDYKGYAAISGYPTDTMLNLYGDWHRHDYVRKVQVAHGKKEIETLWTNHPPPAIIQNPLFR